MEASRVLELDLRTGKLLKFQTDRRSYETGQERKVNEKVYYVEI